MLADDMQKAEAKGQRTYSDNDIAAAITEIIADEMTAGSDKDAVILTLAKQLAAMAKALRDAQDEIRDMDERVGKTLSLLTKASNTLSRKD